ncbi:MAG: dephospho-CoA kinase [Acidobacteriaceae bacterium]|nr:dephospho-CoA kinase [Acidobacteriaceae bacterium]
MLKVGLTGGVASGKSTVGEMFAALGADLIKADEIAHRLMQPGQLVYQHVVHHFGPEILNSDKTINRARLAEVAFGNSSGQAAEKPPRIKELNQIVHPAVIQYHDDWMEEVGRRNPQAIAIVEAALLLEAGAEKSFDRLVVVTCRPEQRIERWAQRMKIDEESARREVTRRMAAQFSDEEKTKYANYTIDNSGTLEETKEQVQVIYKKLKTGSKLY